MSKRTSDFFSRKNRSLLTGVFLFAFIIRLVFLQFYPMEIFPDAAYYKRLGKIFFEIGTIESTKVMPLYPILSGIKEWLGIGVILDVIISASSAVIIYLLSLELFSNKRAALLAALGWSIYPFSIFYSLSGLTESTFTFLLLFCFLLFYRKKFIWAFIIGVLSILVRPTLDYLMPILIIAFGLFVHKMSIIETIKLIPKYLLVYCIFMLAWWAHNYHQYDTFVRLNLGDGVMWYDGNNPLNHTGSGRVGNMDHSQFKSISNPIEKNDALKKEAFKWIRSNPKKFVKLIQLRLIRFWNIFPNATEYKGRLYLIISILSFLPILIGSLIYLFTSKKELLIKSLPIILLFLYLSLIHALTVGSIRYRFPLESFMVLFLGYVIAKYSSKKLANGV